MRVARLTRPSHDTRGRRGLVAALLAAALVATSVGVTAAGSRASWPAADPAVITDWNATAVATIVTDAGKANAEAFIWYGFVHAAIYNAVVGITGKYTPYKWHPRAPRGASPEAAAASAGYHLLLHYFPASQPRLDADYAASLDGIPDGRAKDRGIAFGERAANRIIALREDDGRNAPVTFDTPLAPGVWRPTPPAFAPFFAPWMGQMRPLLIRSADQFRPNEPPALTSRRYARDFNEVKETGAATDSTRTPLMTETALFFAGLGLPALQVSLRDLVTRRGFDISKSARLFAAVDMSIADGIIVSWDSKFHFGFWRPVTAIQLADTDGNPATEADADWLPIVNTPPYPDYTSGMSSVIGALTRSLTRVLGTRRVDLNIASTSGVTRHYEFAGQLDRDVIDARVWSGIHFRFADTAGNRQGHRVADWALARYFKPKHKHRH